MPPRQRRGGAGSRDQEPPVCRETSERQCAVLNVPSASLSGEWEEEQEGRKRPASYKGSGAGATHQRTSPVEWKSTSSYTAPGSCLVANDTPHEGKGCRQCDEHRALTIAGKNNTTPWTKQTRTTRSCHFVKIAPPPSAPHPTPLGTRARRRLTAEEGGRNVYTEGFLSKKVWRRYPVEGIRAWPCAVVMFR